MQGAGQDIEQIEVAAVVRRSQLSSAAGMEKNDTKNWLRDSC